MIALPKELHLTATTVIDWLAESLRIRKYWRLSRRISRKAVRTGCLTDAGLQVTSCRGVFDLGDPNTIFDKWEDKYSSKLDYSRHVRIITYNK